jgi:signal transduction histidine kinase
VKLSRFITAHLDDILQEWVSFARTLGPVAQEMSLLALQDHAKQILQDIALDIETSQNPAEQYEKSMGQAPDDEQSAAADHGTLRQVSDFSLVQLAAEFRALRATVLRLWLPQVTQMSASTVQEMVRFNEAIDQALAESVVTYSARADQSRELFLAILGHDLRAPLSTMAMAGELLRRPQLPPDQVPVVAARIQRSAKLMTSMVADLLGFTRTQLGSKMPVIRAATDMKKICEEAVEDASATHPGTTFQVHAAGSLGGSFDAVRLHQLFTNLLVNAAQYGASGRPVVISASGGPQEIVVQVTNHGEPIPEAAWRSIFKPLIQLPSGDDDERPRTSLGLGLFVAREIAIAHGGSIDVKSDGVDGTTFTVRLPVPGDASPVAAAS